MPDSCASEMGCSLQEYLLASGTLITANENAHNAPLGGGYIGALYAGRHGFLQVDLYREPLAALVHGAPNTAQFLDRLPGASTGVVPLFNRADQPAPAIAPVHISERAAQESDERKHCLDFTYLMLSIAAKYLARDPESDMKLMLFPKPSFEEAIEILNASEVVGTLDWSIPNTAIEKVDRLRHLAGKAELLSRHANAKGVPIPAIYCACLGKYLGLVDGIVRTSAERAG